MLWSDLKNAFLKAFGTNGHRGRRVTSDPRIHVGGLDLLRVGVLGVEVDRDSDLLDL
jgi:hypothetical protein